MSDDQLLTEINSWVGIATAFAGVVIATPAGTKHLIAKVHGWLRSLAEWIRVHLLRRQPKEPTRSGIGNPAGVTIGVKLAAHGHAWPSHAPVDEQIRYLRDHIHDLERRVARHERDTSRELDAVRREIAGLEQTVQEQRVHLRQTVATARAEAARIDARGLPVIWLGILLTAVPGRLAALPLPLAWFFPLLGIGIIGLALVHALWKWRRARAAARDAEVAPTTT